MRNTQKSMAPRKERTYGETERIRGMIAIRIAVLESAESLQRSRQEMAQCVQEEQPEEVQVSFRSLSADGSVEAAALQSENDAVHRSVHCTDVVPGQVSQENRNESNLKVAAALAALRLIPSKENLDRLWKIVETYGVVVDGLRLKMSQEVLDEMEKAFQTNVVAQNDDWVGYTIACGFDKSARYMSAELEKKSATAPECFNELDCAICMDEMDPNNRTITDCKHGFCTDCIGMWKSCGGRKCPLCNTAFDQSASPARLMSDVQRWPHHYPSLDDDEPVYRSGLGEDAPPSFRTMEADDEYPVHYQSLDAPEDGGPVQFRWPYQSLD